MSLHSNSNGAYDPLQQNEQNGIPEDGITSQHGDAEASGPDEQMRAAIKELRDVLEALAQRLDGQTTVSSLHSPTKHGLRASTLGRAEILAIVLKWFIQVLGLAAAIIFGVFTVFAWTDAKEANYKANAALDQGASALVQGRNAISKAGTAIHQADTSNLLALGALCASQVQSNRSAGIEMQSLCSKWARYGGTLASEALGSMLVPSPSTADDSSSSTSDSPAALSNDGGSGSGAVLSSGDKLIIGLAVGLGLPVIIVSVLTVLRLRYDRLAKRRETSGID